MIASLDYVPVDLDAFTLGTPPGADLFLRLGNDFVLYREASIPFGTSDSLRLRANGVDNLWIHAPSEHGAADIKELKLLINLSDEQLPVKAKATILYQSSLNVVQAAVMNPTGEKEMSEVKDLLGLSIGYLESSESAFSLMLASMRHEFSVYIHAVNVATLALGLGKSIGISNSEDLRVLGLGALLHDVGKTFVPARILSKPGPLNSAEMQFIHQHPRWGQESLALGEDLPPGVIEIVAQHHERLDGSGYPDRIPEKKQHPYAKLLALIDSYEALTGNRPYRKSLSPFEALRVLKKDVGSKLDVSLFTQLVLLLGNPVLPEHEKQLA